MPIVYNQLIPGNVGLAGYAVAKELARQTVAQFGAVRGVGVGIGNGSCCAAVAMALPHPPAPPPFPHASAVTGYAPLAPGAVYPLPTFGAALPYGAAFGNSQLAAGGLALGPLGGHAERAALTAAGGNPLYTLPGGNNAVLFVELAPCAPCQAWLNGGGDGVVNPYNGMINGAGAITLNVWFRWPYPGGGGVAAMTAFHALPLPAQLADINANW